MAPRRIALVAFSLLSLIAAPARAGGWSRDFAFRDRDLLQPGQSYGGRVIVPDEVDSDDPAPLVILLHGTNAPGILHRSMGGGALDVGVMFRRWVKDGRPPAAMLDAPSQTRNASTGGTLWTDFDATEIVESTERAIHGRASIDRRRVVVVGHSGAGCNSAGGMQGLASLRRNAIRASLVVVDTCLDRQIGAQLAGAPSSVLVYWQTVTWPRDYSGFLSKFFRGGSASSPIRTAEEIPGLTGNPHSKILPEAMVRAISQILR